ncbi:ubiquitin-like-specific protease 1D isoform X2 [Herrania umbratica]|uniref:Ubiquitin-like-specific protease 1D isoform X2 n=1 Tax=Herrania umbratica TaxID=108875 RepID=A0A6J1B2U6_9ROSI|nr:ubiquitin-like-specific protease 1D isoform X2 [Herrania umbratica]
MEAEEKNKKRKLDLDWTKLLSRELGDEGPPPPLVVIKIEPQPSPSKSDSMGGGGDQGKDEFSENLPDHKLEEMIQRQQRNLEHLGSKLPDKGKKIRDRLERLEEEKKRRTLSRAKMDAAECEKPTQLSSSDIVGSSNVFEQQSKSHQALSQSTFGSSFCKKMEENTDCRIVNTFDKELSILNRCERKKTRCNGEFSQRERQKVRVSPRRINLKHPRRPSFGDQKGRTALLYSLCDTDDDLPSISKKNAFQVRLSNNSRRRKGQTVVLVDEEEAQLVKTTELEVKLPNCKKDAKIYYPSRDDPESVEICFGDIDSLAPETFLTSQIMNFYIRYLQQQASPTNRAICDYHFFNTYFYQKLKEAVSYKGSDKDALFIKFRRWWKGVNIFQRAYVLIPINEDFHWSLVIICIPDKEDESGPIILHLDSLGLHCSRSVFKNIKSYMREEWNYLNQEVAPSDLPIADKIWENLPRRIEEKTIAVPQQKNDYDCGLFVLFFMERFIEEAPERLKKKDLAMFGKQWFRPEEASSLRVKLRNLLIEQFRSASENMGGSQSSPSLS